MFQRGARIDLETSVAKEFGKAALGHLALGDIGGAALHVVNVGIQNAGSLAKEIKRSVVGDGEYKELKAYYDNTKALVKAVQNNDLPKVLELRSIASLEAVNSNRRTPLEEAVYNGNDKISNALLDTMKQKKMSLDVQRVEKVAQESEQASKNPEIVKIITGLHARMIGQEMSDALNAQEAARKEREQESLQLVNEVLYNVLGSALIKPKIEGGRHKEGKKDLKTKIQDGLRDALLSFGKELKEPGTRKKLEEHLNHSLDREIKKGGIGLGGYTISDEALKKTSALLTILEYHPHQKETQPRQSNARWY